MNNIKGLKSEAYFTMISKEEWEALKRDTSGKTIEEEMMEYNERRKSKEESTEKKDETSSEKIDINKATKDKLKKLPNIGDKTAEGILQYRETNTFEKIEDLKKVKGIGKKTYEKLESMIIVTK